MNRDKMTGNNLDITKAWMEGDFGKFDKFGLRGTNEIVSMLDLRPGMTLLDAGCGAGDFAIMASKKGCGVTGIDINLKGLEQARAKAEADNLKIKFETGDIRKLNFENNSFDAVVSIFAAIFVPGAERAASELTRVCKPGGYIAMTTQTPTGFFGKMAHIVISFVEHQTGSQNVPTEVETHFSWGFEDKVRERFTRGISDIQITRHMFPVEFPFSEEGVVEFYKESFGPFKGVFSRLSSDKQQQLTNELVKFWKENNKAKNGTSLAEGEYLLVIARKEKE